MHTPEQRKKKLNLMLSFVSALPLKRSGLELCEENFTKVEGWGVVAKEASSTPSIPLQIKDSL